MGWIVIRRWDEFQHRDMARSTVPPWVKAYTKLMSDEEFLELSFHLRGLLVSLWLEYARARRQLSDSTVGLSRRLGHRVTARDLQALADAGFIEIVASKPAGAHDGKVASLEKREKLVTTLLTEEREEEPAVNQMNDRQDNPLIDKLVAEIRDADMRTVELLHLYEHKLPEAAFVDALEALQWRRSTGEPIQSEARYVVGTLRMIEKERHGG